MTGSGMYQEDSQATVALVLGILGLVLCGILAPFAWNIGSKELAGIEAGRRDPSNRGVAQAGRILGIIGTILLGLGAAFVTVFVLIAVVASAS